MRLGAYAALAFVAVVLDATVAPEVEILGARPDLLVLVVVYGSLALGSRPATIGGFLMGLVVDTELPEYLGLHAFALAVVGFLSAGIWEHLVRSNVFVQCGVLLVATMLHDGIYYLVYYRNHLDMYTSFLARYGLLGGLYTAALGALVFGLARARGWRAIAGDRSP
ncbi:MAG: rod shape-determining protein MreD [Candidatus Eisenbacteria bacterium]|nr:rod shape-determining protein MreD [Candidatus Eisenbacteria bacterium]